MKLELIIVLACLVLTGIVGIAMEINYRKALKTQKAKEKDKP